MLLLYCHFYWTHGSSQTYIINVAIEMFKVKNNLCPAIVQRLFYLNNNPRSDAYFHRPNVNSVYKGEQSVRNFGAIVWNTMVPAELKKTFFS